MKVLYHHLLETTTVFGWLGSPLAPGMPGGPKSPFWPLGPASPLGPTCPMIPCFPLSPDGPIMPLSPFAPGMPAGPGPPFCPFSPASPFAPTGPLFPGDPISLCLLSSLFVPGILSLPSALEDREGLGYQSDSPHLLTCEGAIFPLKERVWKFLSWRRLLVYFCWYSVADPGEGPVGPPPLFLDRPPFPLIKGSGWPPPVISRSGSGTGIIS